MTFVKFIRGLICKNKVEMKKGESCHGHTKEQNNKE